MVEGQGSYQIDNGVLEIARMVLEVNIAKQAILYPMSSQNNMELLTA